MANKRNKVKFGLCNVHWAKITQWGADADGTPTVPVYGESVRLPGAVSLSIDANGENENFYADDSVYYVINNKHHQSCEHRVQQGSITKNKEFQTGNVEQRYTDLR